MRVRTALLAFALCISTGLSSLPVAAQSTAPASRPDVLPRACEADLALSAAPEHLRPEATVYALEANGYVKTNEGTNGFSCIVNRDHPRVLKPTCFDAEGSATIIPKILHVGKRLMQGMPVADINDEVNAGFESGKFVTPQRPGIAYMLSHYNRPYNASTDSLAWFPPHLMFYAPNLQNEDIGVSWEAIQADHRLPFIGYQGPHGYMISLVEHQNRPQEHPLPHCPTWVSEGPPVVAHTH